MTTLDDFARKLQRDAKRAGWRAGASRCLEGWKVILTYGTPTENEARTIIGAALGQAFLERYEKTAPEGDANDVRGVWHLSASWRHGGSAPIGAKAQLAMLLMALRVPAESRDGIEPIHVFDNGVLRPKVTHVIWRETPTAKA